MANFSLANRIEIVNPAANVDATYGPYDSVSVANSSIIEGLRVQGRTVGILSGGTVVEYWWKDGVTDVDLVEKISGGGGSALTVTDSTTSVTEVSQITFTGADVSTTGPGLATVSGLVPYTGATQDVDLGAFQLSAGQVAFDLTLGTAEPAGVGVLRWNDGEGTLDLGLKGGNVTLQVGQEEVIRAVNGTGADLLESNFRAVKIIGAQGQRLKVDLAQANNDINSATTIGIVTEDIANNQEGFITTSGNVNRINTTGDESFGGLETWQDGDILYLDPLHAGYLTNVKPLTPAHLIVVGFVVHAHVNQGKIFVSVNNGYELEELHDVLVTDVADNELLQYNSAGGYWENRTLAEAGIQPAGSYATAAQGALADTAVQPSDLATVATSGSFLDLEDLPNTLAGYGITDAATSAQGSLADSATQPSDNISTLTNDSNYIPSDITGVAGADKVANIISLTQAQYDVIVPDEFTIYNITDAPPPTGLQAVVDDTAPELGGDLDASNQQIINLSRINGTPTSTIIDGAASGATATQPNDDVSTLNNDAGYTSMIVDTVYTDLLSPEAITFEDGPTIVTQIFKRNISSDSEIIITSTKDYSRQLLKLKSTGNGYLITISGVTPRSGVAAVIDDSVADLTHIIELFGDGTYDYNLQEA